MKNPQGGQANLFLFVKAKHVEQKRKYTHEPYFTHVQAVAEMADGKCNFGWEIGLCHDLFEDTDCILPELFEALMYFGYTEYEASDICDAVDELTDVYTHEAYEELNRKARKKLEAERLHKISPAAQTVKYCDLIDNSSSIVDHDPGFAKTYIPEKEYILNGMDKGNKELYEKALESLNDAKRKLNLI